MKSQEKKTKPLLLLKILIMTDFGTTLLEWYKTNGRALPWRETSDPYKIWISEIILQQTQVVQGTDYYHRFLKTFPDVNVLAAADEDEILRQWQGLGYYSRARNLHSSAKTIVSKHDSVFPDNHKDILALKGIGPYTAAAIASIAFNLPYPVIDGNVYRFLSRLKSLSTPIDSNEGKKQFEELATELLNKKDPGNHNQAMMEIGALICRPQNPDCTNCPFHNDCMAYQTGTTKDFPVKSKKLKQRNRYFNYFLIQPSASEIVIDKRNENDIWKNLYQLPLLETDKTITAKQLEKLKGIKAKLISECKHILSHQIIYTRFFSSDKKSIEQLKNSNYEQINISQCESYAFPQLVVNFLNEQKLSKYGRK
jgi:A/G-specific adenine glycosylase